MTDGCFEVSCESTGSEGSTPALLWLCTALRCLLIVRPAVGNSVSLDSTGDFLIVPPFLSELGGLDLFRLCDLLRTESTGVCGLAACDFRGVWWSALGKVEVLASTSLGDVVWIILN